MTELTTAGRQFTVQVDKTSESQWNELLDQFADANLYQTWAYGALSWGESQLSHFALRDKGQPVALAQLRIVRLPAVRAGVAYLRWGPVCTPKGGIWDPVVWRAALQALVAEYVERRRLALRILPQLFHGDSEGRIGLKASSELNCYPETTVRPYRTFRVNLEFPLEDLRKRLDQKWRNQLNAAERNGLAVTEGTGDEIFAQFLELYGQMMARKRFETTVDADEFRRIQRRLPDRQKMLVLIARKGASLLAGLVGSAVGDRGIYLLGATGDEGMKSKGAYLLQWHMLCRLKEQGCRWYDLGGINPEQNPGVYHFKKGLGGQEVFHLDRLDCAGGICSKLCLGPADWAQRVSNAIRSRLRGGDSHVPSREKASARVD